MEAIKINYINTTTAIVVNSSTATAEYIMRRDTSFQYISTGFNNDATTTTMRINLDSTLAVTRIVLAGMNFKKFNLYYNGVTANTFAISGGLTTTSQWLTNSETSLYIKVSSVNCTSVSLDIYSTQVANSEKALGYYVLSDLQYAFDRIPASSGYKPILDSEQVLHKLSDGSKKIQLIDEKWNIQIKYKHLDSTMVASLRTLYNLRDGFVFAPWETNTAWDALIFPCIWENDFDFYQYSADAVSSGFTGSIKLSETTPA